VTAVFVRLGNIDDFRVIVAGSRDFNDYNLLQATLDKLLSNKKKVIIISGTTRGADRLGEQYAKERGFAMVQFHAQWDIYGKRAGYLRNEEMAQNANACVCFWDGVSRGTSHMIDLAKRYSLDTRVIKY
jgi:hypothetical protein